MELISVGLARVLWFIRTDDLNPRGLNLTHTLYPHLIAKYRFTNYPTIQEIATASKEKATEFKGGQFVNSKGESISVALTDFFDEAVIADTRSSTRDSEAFLAELLEWMTTFGLTFRQDMILSKSCLSEVIVKCDRDVSRMFRHELQGVADKITELVSSADNLRPYRPAGFSIVSDSTAPPGRPAPFVFELAVGASFRENRFFSRAPLHTDDHLELLNELERLF